jgi:PAS domain S-box-containing protein
LRLLMVDAPPGVRDLIRVELSSHYPVVQLIEHREDLDPSRSDAAHAALLAHPGNDRDLPKHVARVKQRFPDVPVILLASKPNPAFLAYALEAGADDVVDLDEGPTVRLLVAVRSAIERTKLIERVRAAESERRLAVERISLLNRATGEATWDWDLVTHQIWWSNGFQRLFGYSEDEIVPSVAWWKERIHPDDLERVIGTTSASIVGDDHSMTMEYRFRRRDGSYATVLDRGFVVYDEQRHPIRVIGAMIDITEHRRSDAMRVDLLGREREARATAEVVLDRLSVIERVTDAALAHLPLDRLLVELLERLRAAIFADAAMAYLLTEDATHLIRRAWVGLDARVDRRVRIPLGQGISGRIAASGEPMMVEDLSTIQTFGNDLNGRFRSLLGVPLIVEAKVIGVLSVVTRERRRFTSDDQRLLELVAGRVAPAIDRVNLLDLAHRDRQRLEALSRQLVTLQEEERRRVARELHDDIGQLLTALKLALETRMPASLEPERVVQDLIARVRDISISLRPPMLEDLGLHPALRWHFERFTGLTGVRVEFSQAGLDRRFPPEVETAAFRIVQEALTNVARHAATPSASVTVDVNGGRVHLRVEDRGNGFDPQEAAPGRCNGLTGMRERVSLLAGRFSIRSAPGEGTIVSAEIPIGSRAQETGR